jgi:GNAT superfamily N-acetyltransferase
VFVRARTDCDQHWVAEWEGRLVGSIAIVSHSERDAQLCWLLVDPSVRSLELGRKLLHEAVVFCRCRRYEWAFLRGFRALAAASRLFPSAGFEKVEGRRSERWGVAVIEEWYVLHPPGRRPPLADRIGMLMKKEATIFDAASFLKGAPGSNHFSSGRTLS